MKKVAVFLLIVPLIGGCLENESPFDSSLLESDNGQYLTWELIEIKTAGHEWKPVSTEQRHTLKFISETQVDFEDQNKSCTGTYLFETLENSLTTERLTLHVPCLVDAAQLWIEHLIESKTEDEVVTLPCLNPTAMICSDRYKYRINRP